VLPADAATILYLFGRHPETHKLRYIGTEASELEPFNRNNTVCAWKTKFLTQRNPFQSYSIIEYQDYMTQTENIFTYVPKNKRFMMFNSADKTWYSYYNGSSSDLLPNEEPEMSKLSLVCYTDEFILSDGSDNRPIVVTGLATLASILAIISATIYIIAMFYNHLASWMGCSALFSIATIVGTSLKYEMGREIVPLISTLTHFCILFILMRMLILLILVMYFSDEKKDGSLWGPTMTLKISPKMKYVDRILMIMAIAAFIGTLCLYSLNIVGPDNASLQTGHFYVNTLIGSSDDIRRYIKLM
jgi:hypothetical protein